jgi:ABC-2 type transport system permease protein
VNLAPGSARWLLRHEIRLLWYSVGSGKGGARRQPAKLTIGIWLGVWLVLHGLAYALLRQLGGAGAQPPHQLLVGITGVLVVSITMMLSSGLKSSVEVLFERGDLDLLLSSPIPSRSIFAARLTGMVVGIAGLYLFFLGPFANVGLLLGQLRWLALYPTIISAAAIAAALSMLLTLGLVRTLGARRTRVVAQVLGALAGACLFLVAQAYSLVSQGSDSDAASRLPHLLEPGGALGPDSLAWLPGRAAMGEPAPLFGLLLIAAGIVFITIHFTHRFFVHGLQQAASTARVTRRTGAPRYRFGRSLAQVIIIKEWRLIARDPHLISQVLLQLFYILPICIPLFTASDRTLPPTGAALTLLTGSLTASLAWIILSAEDAPDLLRASPASERVIRHAKLAAAAMPALAIAAVPLLWLMVRAPVAALLVCFTVVTSALNSALIVRWSGRRASRGEFNARGKSHALSNLFEMLNALAWGGVAFALLTMHAQRTVTGLVLLGATTSLVTGLAVLLAAWLLRRRTD